MNAQQFGARHCTVVLLISQVRVYAQVSVLGRFGYTLGSQVWWRGQLRFTPRFRNFSLMGSGPWGPPIRAESKAAELKTTESKAAGPGRLPTHLHGELRERSERS